MPSANPVWLSRLGQLGRPVLPDGLEEAVAHVDAFAVDHHQGLVDQVGEEVEDLELYRRSGTLLLPHHRLRRLEVEAARKDSQAAQGDLLGGGEQVVAPVHRRRQRLVPGHSSADPSGEQPEALIQSPGQVLGAEDPDAGGGELEGQGDAVEAPADLGDGGGVGLARTEAGLGPSCPLAEEGHGVRARQILHAGRLGGGEGEGGHPPGHLARQPQDLPAGGQDGDAWAAGQQHVNQFGGRLDDVLAVVADDEGPLGLEVLGEPVHEHLRGSTWAGGQHAQGTGHHGGHERRIGQPAQLDQHDAVREILLDTGRHLQGQAGLPASSNPGQRHEAGLAEQATDLLDLLGPSDEGGDGGGKGVPPAGGA